MTTAQEFRQAISNSCDELLPAGVSHEVQHVLDPGLPFGRIKVVIHEGDGIMADEQNDGSFIEVRDSEDRAAHNASLVKEFCLVLTLSKVRAEVQSFAVDMERKLAKHDHGFDSWKYVDNQDLMDGLNVEMAELQVAINSCDEDGIIDEAADVANFAMMLFDNAVRRKAAKTKTKPKKKARKKAKP